MTITPFPDLAADARLVRARRRRRSSARLWVAHERATGSIANLARSVGATAAVVADTVDAVEDMALALEVDRMWRNA